MIKAIIFDCFGVIVSDALSVIVGKLAATDPDGAKRARYLVGQSNRGQLDPDVSNRQVAEILGVDYASYRKQIADGEVKDMALLEYICSLRPRYKTALLSNISPTGLKLRFTDKELRECFDEAISSGEIGYAKPEPRAYEIAAERLGVRPDECVFVDDSEGHCQAARDLGMQAITYTSFGELKPQLEKLLQSK